MCIRDRNYFSRKKGQFIYGKQNLFNGAFGLIHDKLDGFLSSSDVPTLDINHKKLNGTFLVCYFSRESFYKKLEGLASGSGSKRIHETTLLDIKIHLPSLEEQAQIANFLSVINKKLETEKLILGNYIKPVSYTHLDVYKRQVQRCFPPASPLDFITARIFLLVSFAYHSLMILRNGVKSLSF